jgi:long-subunit acyl-CoA synthetase (AMP-forming)
VILNGGAPIPRHIAEFFRIVLVESFWNGYGATETTATGLRT